MDRKLTRFSNSPHQTADTSQLCLRDVTISECGSIICFPVRLPRWLSGKEPTCQGRRLEFSPWVGLGRSSGGGNGNPLQYACLENPMDRGAWRATVYGVAQSDTTEQACTGRL